jgi:hypothetical protein
MVQQPFIQSGSVTFQLASGATTTSANVNLPYSYTSGSSYKISLTAVSDNTTAAVTHFVVSNRAGASQAAGAFVIDATRGSPVSPAAVTTYTVQWITFGS